MKASECYERIVDWSDEDRCFVGQCSGVVGPCCHGDDEAEVFAKLRDIVEWLEILQSDVKLLPPATAGTGVAERIA
jgi:hypothetical protein